MARIAACLLALALAGCGSISSRVIKSDSLAFNDVIEDATNKLLVLNVLRARDKAPLHFADIPVIRESMTQSANANFLEFLGATTGSRDTRSSGLGLQFSPSFEIAHLHSKEFHTGIATPIDPKIVKYWLDRGLDRRIVLLLFFSSAELIETRSEGGPKTTIRIMNSPREAVGAILRRTQDAPSELQRCDIQSDFERYLKLVNTLKTFFANSYRERRLLAGGLNLEVEKDARGIQPYASLDQSKTQLLYDKATRTYSLYTLSPDPKVAFCIAEGSSVSPYTVIYAGESTGASRQNCFRPVVDVPPEDSSRPAAGETPLAFPGPAVRETSRYCTIYNRFVGLGPKPAGEPSRVELRLQLRSVGEIFQFLGDLLHYQDELKRHIARSSSPSRMNTPVTFGYCRDDPSPGCDDVFIRLDTEACNARFSVVYRDRRYHVGHYNRSDNECDPGASPAATDHTLEILAVLHQLVGLHRSAADFRQTPAVQVLP